MNGQRFQNYEAYFTVLNTRESIDKEWLNMLIYDHDNSLKYAQIFYKKREKWNYSINRKKTS